MLGVPASRQNEKGEGVTRSNGRSRYYKRTTACGDGQETEKPAKGGEKVHRGLRSIHSILRKTPREGRQSAEKKRIKLLGGGSEDRKDKNCFRDRRGDKENMVRGIAVSIHLEAR